MSDSVSLASREALELSDQAEASTISPTPTPTVSAGALLRQGRVAAGLHIAALAVLLKVPVRRLEALESDRFDLLPDAVFARALASGVCRALKMDAAPVLAQLPLAAPQRLYGAARRTNDTYTTGNARGFSAWRALPKPVLGSVAALVIATVALLAWPLLQSSWESAEPNSAATVAPLFTDVQAPSDGAGNQAVSGQVVPAGDVSTVVTVPVSSAAEAVMLPGASSPTSLPAAAPVPAAVPSAQATPPVSGIIVFNPSAASWVEVTDAKGAVLLRRMLAAGEVATASGALPLSAVVGRADVTQVMVRGQAFDLKTIARENVARFEVK